MNVECGLQLRDCDICDSIVICNNNIFYRIHNVIFAKGELLLSVEKIQEKFVEDDGEFFWGKIEN